MDGFREHPWHTLFGWVGPLWNSAWAWMCAHPALMSGMIGLLVAAVVVTLMLKGVAFLAARFVMRWVFDDMDAQTIRETTQALQDAQNDAIERIQAADAEARAQMTQVRDQVHGELTALMHQLRSHPESHVGTNITYSVNTPEQRQELEAMLARGRPRVVYRSASSRKTKEEIEREALPTAWQHILQDDEEGAPCPTIPVPETPPPPPAAKKPRRKPQPKKKRG